jgi:hypothetical protein
VLTLYKLTHTLRTGLNGESDLRSAEDRFEYSHRTLRAEGGGVVSVYYHPCEFVHKEFWDGVNFRAGANPPREKWVPPPQKSPEESAVAWRTFESYIRFIRGFDDVTFVTASEAAVLYADRARGRAFSTADVKAVAEHLTSDVTFQRHADFALAPSEIFWLLNRYVATTVDKADRPLSLDTSPLGPTEAGTPFSDELTVDWSQFARSTVDVADYVDRRGRVPSTVWLGSKPTSPESYLVALAGVAATLAGGQPPPDSITLEPARMAAADYVAKDDPRLWGWVIFPPGFRAPAMMELAKRQAWTIKPALLAPAESE